MARLSDTEKREFFDACENGQLRIIEAALKKCPEAVDFKNPDGWTPLALAVQWAQDKAVECLLAHGADMEIRDKDGCTAQNFCERLNFGSIADLFRAAAASRERDAAAAVHAAEIAKFSSGLESAISLPRSTLRLRK